jgi:hypothetical protein
MRSADRHAQISLKKNARSDVMADTLLRWVWVPTDPGQRRATLVCMLVVALLGVIGIPKFPTFREFYVIELPLSITAFVTVAMSILNFYFLIKQSDGVYLTSAIGRRPRAVSYVILSLLWPAAWGLYLLCRHEVRLPYHDWAAVDPLLNLKIIFTGEAALSVAFLTSGIWHVNPNPKIRELAQARAQMIGLCRNLHPQVNRQVTIQPDTQTAIQSQLKSIGELSEALGTQFASAEERTLCSIWHDAAKSLASRFVTMTFQWQESDLAAMASLSKERE